MSLLITGGLGFLGVQVARHYIRRGTVWAPRWGRAVPLEQLTLFDVGLPAGELPEDLTSDSRVRIMAADLTEDGVAEEIVDDDSLSVVHLASMVSGDTEADHLKGWQVNVEGQRRLLEALRTRAPGARFVFTSSTASLGPVAPGAPDADDLTKLLPQNTYGFHKAVCELMINDYARRGFVDARALRLPVVVVRPGAPNAALTGAWSSVVREPLNGHDVTIPVPMDVKLPVASYQAVVRGISAVLDEVSSDSLGPDRTLMLPSLSTSPQELYDAAGALARERGIKLGEARARAEEVATRIVSGMGERSDGRRAEALGLQPDESAESIVRAYADEYVEAVSAGGDTLDA
jgi:nucleoside-diphosphate-sugar epimerase